MSSPYTPVEVWDEQITIPSDGDSPTVSSVNPAIESLSDRTQYLYGLRAGRFQVPLVFGYSDGFDYFRDGNLVAVEQTGVATAGSAWFPITPPTGVMIAAIRCTIDGNGGTAGGSHAGLPATMPRISLVRIEPPASSIQDAAIDSSVDVSSYEDVHVLEATGINYTVVQQEHYYIQIEGESGANAAANHLALYSLQLELAYP